MCFTNVGLYTDMELKNLFIFLQNLSEKLNVFHNRKSNTNLIVKNKSNNKAVYNPVTNYDRSFEKLIRSIIQKSFPKDAITGEELKDKNEQANATLQQMVKDQNEAETRKVEAVKLKEDLDERNKVVDARREEAEADLANAEPALLAAQEAVKSIKKKHLDEMRALGNPPKNVKLTLEAVAIMIKGITDAKKIPDWRALRTLLRGSSFISDVVGFDPHALVPETRQLVQSKYLNVDLRRPFQLPKILFSDTEFVS